MSITIRDARRDDEARWRILWGNYLTFYKAELADEVTDSTWSRIFDPASSLFLRVAEVDGVIEGFALSLTHESGWATTPVCYLEDLFTTPQTRGQGIGRALIDDLKELGAQKSWSSVYWMTQHDNTTARKLYDSYGLTDGFVSYSIKL